MTIKRITFSMLMLVGALVLSVSCSDGEITPGPLCRETFYVGQGGTPVSNPVNSQFCKQDKAKETLESIRHIAGLVYRMDYLSPSMMDEFVEADIRSDIRRDSLINEWYFTREGWESPMDYSGFCSGFVCRNEKGDLLFCRNFDGSNGDCLAVFDRINGYKKVMLTALSTIPNYIGRTMLSATERLPCTDLCDSLSWLWTE